MKIKDPSGGVADYVSTGTVLTSDIQNVEADTIYELASTFTEGRTTTSLVHRDKHGRYDRVHKKINGTDYEIIEFARVIPIAESRAHMEAGLEATATSISYAGNSLAVELLVGGGKVSNIPNGEYTYTGTNLIAVRGDANPDYGTFTMDVNFGSGSASLNGNTPTSTISGTGITVNRNDGTFASDSISITGTSKALSATGSIYGNFHGDRATGLTGIYHDNADSPTVAGAIAGSRSLVTP